MIAKALGVAGLVLNMTGAICLWWIVPRGSTMHRASKACPLQARGPHRGQGGLALVDIRFRSPVDCDRTSAVTSLRGAMTRAIERRERSLWHEGAEMRRDG